MQKNVWCVFSGNSCKCSSNFKYNEISLEVDEISVRLDSNARQVYRGFYGNKTLYLG